MLLTMLSTTAVAAPWVKPGNERTRHHLQNLVDFGVSSSLVTSWPLMWNRVNQELKKIDASKLPPNALWSYQYLKHEIKQENRVRHTRQQLYGSNVSKPLRGFADNNRFQQEANLSINYTGDQLAFELNTSYVRDSNNEYRNIFDGSHLSYTKGNWVFGVGAIDRWWGPGWDSSLILSHNARPAPSLFLQRNLSEPFKTPLLSWLGPWQLTTFMAQLESDRATSDARLWGMRVSFRPLQSLELGLSRTAQWGGHGRPGGLDTFVELLAGIDNYEDEDEKLRREPGNQLAGIDWRWGSHFGDVSAAFYGQLIGEDEAGGLPSRHIGLAGIELSTLMLGVHTRFSLEGKNTTVYFYESDKIMYNTAYEHPLYPNGYRHKGLPMGASTDNDSESIAFSSLLYFSNGHSAKLTLGKYRINIEGKNKSAPAGNIYGGEQANILKTEVSYALPLLDHLMIEAGAFSYSEALSFEGQVISSGAFVQFQTRW